MRMHRFMAAALAVACLSLGSAYAADITQTAANVVPGADAVTERGISGETVTAGAVVYKQVSSGKWMLADADSATPAVRQGNAIALNGASLNQPLVVQRSGLITIGATVTAGAPYYLSNTPGKIMPSADLSTGEYVNLVGFAASTGTIRLNFIYTGIATP